MDKVKLSIIIPVYNEINTVSEIIRQVKNEPHDKEIIIIDDCSNDGTRELLQGIDENDIRVIFNQENKGKGNALRQAFPLVTGDIVIIQDADLEYYPDEYGNLIEKILQDKADVVYGSRFLGAHRVFHFYHYAGNLAINLMTNVLLNTNLTDLMTGYKAFKQEVIKKIILESDGFGIETEITAEVFKRGYKVYETPISYNGRGYDEGKKIRWIDFFKCLYWLIRSISRGIDVGQDTLLKMRLMVNNNIWSYNKIKPFLGKNVLETGSGIGTFSNYLAGKDRDVVFSDINNEYLKYLKNRFISNPRVKIIKADVSKLQESIPAEQFDTVVSINVLEHIDTCDESLRGFYGILEKNGLLLLIVPAHKALFSLMDKRLGHYRRFSRKELAQKLEAAGFSVEKCEYMNFLSAIGWFAAFNILKKQTMPRFTIICADKLIPLTAFLEKYIRFPFGLSVFVVARKK